MNSFGAFFIYPAPGIGYIFLSVRANSNLPLFNFLTEEGSLTGILLQLLHGILLPSDSS